MRSENFGDRCVNLWIEMSGRPGGEAFQFEMPVHGAGLDHEPTFCRPFRQSCTS